MPLTFWILVHQAKPLQAASPCVFAVVLPEILPGKTGVVGLALPGKIATPKESVLAHDDPSATPFIDLYSHDVLSTQEDHYRFLQIIRR